ncbi:MAG: transglutaminase-like domain-containing protein [Candidatus Delongbacteria bacterium]
MIKRAGGMALILLLIGVTQARADGLDSLLAVQRGRAGGRAAELFAPLEPSSSLGGTARDDYRFLLAHLPLSDLAELEAEDLRENVRLAHQARERFPWGARVPAELWRHYVLPARVSQEPFTRWRARFLAELAPRLEGLDMGAAALEVNHWCHEQATYRPTDGRDQDPLTTCRAGFGRCEEEMILAIAALRSVGIPARQCYTPYWAHSDDNHAWVEVWTDGAWSFFGACEPAPELGQAWFTGPARRAMLVVSQAYGAMERTGEPILRREGRSTSVNSTAVYGPVKTLRLQVTDAKGRPQPGQRVIFHLYNYGGWMPALVQTTDEQGRLELVCGRGSWLVSAGSKGLAGLLHVEPAQTEARLVLGARTDWTGPARVDYAPPPPAPEPEPAAGLVFAEGVARGLVDTAAVRRADQVFQQRLQQEDSLREARVWSRGPCTPLDAAGVAAPDSLGLRPLLESSATLGAEPGAVWTQLLSARGNAGVWLDFLAGRLRSAGPASGGVPDSVWSRLEPAALRRRLDVLEACSDKDRVEIGGATLCELESALARLDTPAAGDSLGRARWLEHVVAPRVDGEACRPWRADLTEFLERHPRLRDSRGDKALLRWIRRELRREPDRDRLGAPLTPAQVLELGGGTAEDLERFYLGCCRVRGRVARTNPLSGRLERWEAGAWHSVRLFRPAGPTRASASGHLSLAAADSLSMQARCLKDWCLLRWDVDHLEALDLGWQQPLSHLEFPLELPAGRYVLCTGRRREDGSAPVHMQWLEIKPGTTLEAELRLDP